MTVSVDQITAAMRARHMRSWTDAEDTELRRYLASGMSYSTAALKLGRGYDGIRRRARTLGLAATRVGRPSDDDIATRKQQHSATADLWTLWQRANEALRRREVSA